MKPELTPKEAEITITFLNRVDIKGAESDAHAYLKSKLKAIAEGKDLPTPEGANIEELEGAKGNGKT